MDDLSCYLLATGWQDCKLNEDNVPVEIQTMVNSALLKLLWLVNSFILKNISYSLFIMFLRSVSIVCHHCESNFCCSGYDVA